MRTRIRKSGRLPGGVITGIEGRGVQGMENQLLVKKHKQKPRQALFHGVFCTTTVSLGDGQYQARFHKGRNRCRGVDGIAHDHSL